MNWEIEDMPRPQRRWLTNRNLPRGRLPWWKRQKRKFCTAEQRHANRVTAELRDAQRAAEKATQAQAVTEEKARKDAERATKVAADAALKQDQKTARDSNTLERKARQKS
ncbi:MAG: hypothetical protein IPI27_11530 [Betaproteobacteria bacterium]|nr:hypothetical protein [Betaproteobacteria bacterium]